MISATLYVGLAIGYGLFFYLIFSIFAGLDLTAWHAGTVIAWLICSVAPSVRLLFEET